MSRRPARWTYIFAIGVLVVAGLILVLGLVLQNQANFANDYVHDQLQAQQSTFTPCGHVFQRKRTRTVCKTTPGRRWSRGSRPSAMRTTTSSCT